MIGYILKIIGVSLNGYGHSWYDNKVYHHTPEDSEIDSFILSASDTSKFECLDISEKYKVYATKVEVIE